MQTMTAPPPGKSVIFQPFRPAYDPVKEFGRQPLGSGPMGVKLKCAAGAIQIIPEQATFRLVRKESADLELALPKKNDAGPWNMTHDPSTGTTIWSISVLVGQLDSELSRAPEGLKVISDPKAIRGAIRYALNRYEQQLNLADSGSDLHIRTGTKMNLIKEICFTGYGLDNAVALYAFKIPHTYGLVSEIAMQLTLNCALYASGFQEFWVNATEFRPGTTQISRHHTGPDHIIHAHQIAVSAEIAKR